MQAPKLVVPLHVCEAHVLRVQLRQSKHLFCNRWQLDEAAVPADYVRQARSMMLVSAVASGFFPPRSWYTVRTLSSPLVSSKKCVAVEASRSGSSKISFTKLVISEPEKPSIFPAMTSKSASLRATRSCSRFFRNRMRSKPLGSLTYIFLGSAA